MNRGPRSPVGRQKGGAQDEDTYEGALSDVRDPGWGSEGIEFGVVCRAGGFSRLGEDLSTG